MAERGGIIFAGKQTGFGRDGSTLGFEISWAVHPTLVISVIVFKRTSAVARLST